MVPECATLFAVAMLLLVYAYQTDISTTKLAYVQMVWIIPVILVTITSDITSINRSLNGHSTVQDVGNSDVDFRLSRNIVRPAARKNR